MPRFDVDESQSHIAGAAYNPRSKYHGGYEPEKEKPRKKGEGSGRPGGGGGSEDGAGSIKEDAWIRELQEKINLSKAKVVRDEVEEIERQANQRDYLAELNAKEKLIEELRKKLEEGLPPPERDYDGDDDGEDDDGRDAKGGDGAGPSDDRARWCSVM